MTAFIGFAAFDTQAESGRAYVGWAQLDTQSVPSRSYIGWASFDTQDVQEPIPSVPLGLGGGGDRGGGSYMVGKYYSNTRKQYNVPIHNVDESEEEEIIMQILMEVAYHVLR